MTTFGVEAEFAVNANLVIAGLYERGLSGARTLHGYHCDCEWCQFRNGYAFRGQTDSSCSGEIITDILGNTDADEGPVYTPEDLFEALADVAVEVDAEPGLNSGIHVHVSISGMNLAHLYEAAWQFVRWEPVLMRIAGGRWPDMRSGMNRTVRENVQAVFYQYTRHLDNGMARLSSRNIATVEESRQVDLPRLKEGVWNQLCGSDRHGNLNTQARRQPTWEYRLWNSTRVAWRMDMFAGLSVCLMNPDVLANLAELEIPLRRNRPSAGIDSIASAVDDAGFGPLAEQLMRQANYLDERAGTAASILTAL